MTNKQNVKKESVKKESAKKESVKVLKEVQKERLWKDYNTHLKLIKVSTAASKIYVITLQTEIEQFKKVENKEYELRKVAVTEFRNIRREINNYIKQDKEAKKKQKQEEAKKQQEEQQKQAK